MTTTDTAHTPDQVDTIEKVRCNLIYMYILSILTIILTATIEVLSLMKYRNFNQRSTLYYYAVLLPIIAGVYIYSIAVLFTTMNHKENPALLPEYKKMKW